MLRITRMDSPNAARRILKIEGRIAGEWTQEVSEATANALAECPTVVLDLGAVTFVDRRGGELLHALRARGIALVNATAFVARLLSGETS